MFFFVLFFLFLLVFPLFCGACQLISNVYWKVCDWRCLDAFCWLFGFGVVFSFVFSFYFFLFFFFTFLCYLAVHVKCTVYHFSDCIKQGYCSAELCWPTRRHWTYELLSVGSTKAAGQKDFDWSALTESFDLSTVCFGISGSLLIAVVITDIMDLHPPFHLFMDKAENI